MPSKQCMDSRPQSVHGHGANLTHALSCSTLACSALVLVLHRNRHTLPVRHPSLLHKHTTWAPHTRSHPAFLLQSCHPRMFGINRRCSPLWRTPASPRRVHRLRSGSSIVGLLHTWLHTLVIFHLLNLFLSLFLSPLATVLSSLLLIRPALLLLLLILPFFVVIFLLHHP